MDKESLYALICDKTEKALKDTQLLLRDLYLLEALISEGEEDQDNASSRLITNAKVVRGILRKRRDQWIQKKLTQPKS